MGDTIQHRTADRAMLALSCAADGGNRLPVLVIHARSIFEKAVAGRAYIDGTFADICFTRWAMLSDDVCEGGLLSLAMFAAQEAFTPELFEVADQIRSTVAWRNCAVVSVDIGRDLLELSDIQTSEVFLVGVSHSMSLLRSQHARGVVSSYIATVDGVDVLIGPILYDRGQLSSGPCYAKHVPALDLISTVAVGGLAAEIIE